MSRSRTADALPAMKKVALMVLGHGDADLRREADRSAGSADARGRHHHRRLRGRERVASRAQRRDASARSMQRGGRRSSSRCGGRVEIAARTALAAMAEGDTLRTLLAALRRLLKTTPVNTVARAAADRRRRDRSSARLYPLIGVAR